MDGDSTTNPDHRAVGNSNKVMSPFMQGHFALFLAQFFFGMFPVFGRIALDPERGFDPWVVAAWRITFGSLAMGALAFCMHRSEWKPRREDLPRFAVCALMGIVANQALFLVGLNQSEAIDAGLVICLIPVWTWLIAVSCRQERFIMRRGLGVLIAFAGMVPLAQQHGMGNALMAANTFCYSVYLVIAKPLTAKYPPLVVLAWVYLLSLPATPFMVWGRSPLPAAPHEFVPWASMAYVLIGATVLSYLLNLYALARVRSSTTAFYIYLQPLITAVGAYYFLDEATPGNYLWAGVGLLIGGVLVIERPKS
jgi:drug/metabolite transporter (DMT)-like permease